MGRRVLRRYIWGYAVCLCPTKKTPGLNELKDQKENIICTMTLSKDLWDTDSVPGKQWNLSRFFFSEMSYNLFNNRIFSNYSKKVVKHNSHLAYLAK